MDYNILHKVYISCKLVVLFTALTGTSVGGFDLGLASGCAGWWKQFRFDFLSDWLWSVSFIIPN